MKILAIYRHYWPDTTPYARLLRAILEHAVACGGDATVLTAQPSYNDVRHEQAAWRETLGGVDVRRVRLLPERKSWRIVRAVNALLFGFRGILFALRHRDHDVVIANSHPPVLMALVLRWINRLTGTPYILHCQDIHPESSLLVGKLKAGWLANLLRRFDAQACADARTLVTLSPDMRKTLEDRGVGTPAIEIVNNFPLDVYDAADDECLPKLFQRPTDRFRVLFAGNMGHFQNLEAIMGAVQQLGDRPEIEFVFMGTGAMRKRLEETAGELNGRTVHFIEHQPVEVAFACMQRAQLGIVSLSEGVYRVAYPSKTMMYLSAGCPILAAVEPESELARTIESDRLGYVPRSTDPEAIAAAILAAQDEAKRWNALARQRLVDYCEHTFGRKQALSRWEAIFGLAARESDGESRKAA